MRRSAAPSALSENYCKAKRVKFEPPFRAIAAESENFADTASNRDCNKVDGMSRHTPVLQKSAQSSQKRIFDQRDSKPHLNKGFSSVDNKDGLKRALLTLRNGSLRDVHKAPSGNPVTITTDEPVLASRDPLTTNCHTSPNEPSALSCDPKSLATCTTAKECSQNPPKPASSLGLPVPAGQAQLRYGSGATSGGSGSSGATSGGSGSSGATSGGSGSSGATSGGSGSSGATSCGSGSSGATSGGSSKECKYYSVVWYVCVCIHLCVLFVYLILSLWQQVQAFKEKGIK